MDKIQHKLSIGFIGQGWVGKHYADDFEARGYKVVRYALEEPYNTNKAIIADCDIVFIAVPTPTKPEGFDDSILRSTMSLVGKGKTAVIKSTMMPGTTVSIQKQYPEIFVLHSPEFLAEKTAAHDAAHPKRNIIGIPIETDDYRAKAQTVMDLLPRAPYEKIMLSRDAEFIKYAGNCFLFSKVIFMNILYDLVISAGADWELVREALIKDPRIGESHTRPVDSSGHSHKSGRGAGGHCFIKDFEVFRRMYEQFVGDQRGEDVLNALKDKNIDLLLRSDKDIDLLEGVYGENIPDLNPAATREEVVERIPS